MARNTSLHGWGLTDDLRAWWWPPAGALRLNCAVPQVILCTAHQGDCLVDVKRFGQVFEGAALVGVDCGVEVRVGRHDDDGQVGLAAMDLFQQAQTVDARHADVRRITSGERISRELSGGFAVGKTFAFQAFAAKVRSGPHRMELSSSTIHTLLS